MTPAATIVVPSYRHGAFIRRRIESILEQTRRDFELIVIDDCSQDDSDTIIRALQAEHGFTYIRNERNSGSPFSAWEQAGALAKGRYLWICESDDVAEPEFLEVGVSTLDAEPQAALFYCDSNVIDTTGTCVGHTDDFFHEIWKETRWDRSFVNDGAAELEAFQVRGQTVPNMSSALIRTSAFREAYRPFLKRLKLTGDWLFIGWVLQQGKVVYQKRTLNNFRRHDATSRASVVSARSQAEFIITKCLLFSASHRPTTELASLLSTDAVRFLHERARWWEVVSALLRISPTATFSAATRLAVSLVSNPRYIERFRARRRMASGGG
ncbi:MAG TPA: glycosyltransferase [Burkholderiaceae bacterium]|nr:glycosyltransferase [Burkholderiaceae bacterium]